MALTLDELKALYKEKGATTRREEETEAGTKYYDDAVQLGDGWTAWENDNRKIIDYIGGGMDAQPVYDDAAKTLGGFQRAEGDKNYYYDTTGKLVHVEKQATDWDYLGPIIMGAITMGGGAGIIGNSLFGLTGTAAAGAGGALAGGFNAAMTDQDILQGALKGGVSSAGALKLGDTGFTLGDVNKAINFAKDPTLAGAANLASPYVTTNFDIGDTGFTTNDLLKGVNTVQALGSGNDKKVFDAITGLAKTYGGPTSGGVDKSTVGNFEDTEITRLKGLGYNKDQINSYFDKLDNLTDIFDNQDAGIPADIGTKNLSSVGLDKETADFLETIGIKTIDDIKDSGLSNQDILNMIGVGADDTVTVTGNKNYDASQDFLTLNAPAGNITNNYTDDLSEVVVTGNKNGTSLSDFISLNTPAGNITDNYADDTVFVTGNKDGDYVPSLRTKEIKSDIPDELTVDDIDTLFPDLDINDILQTVTVPGGTKTVVPTTKTTTPTVKKTTEDLMDSLGLNRQAPSQDPYANIKLMEELFGGDVAYKLRALGAPKNLASADMDALVKLLRG